MNAIEFPKDYKKLHCRVGDIFTTIRRDNDENQRLYQNSDGEVFHVKVEGRVVFRARLLHCDTFVDGLDGFLSEELLEYDSDGDVEGLYARYQDNRVLFLIFQKMRDDKE